MSTEKLATLLLRRKELAEKVQMLRTIKGSELFEIKVERKKVTDNIDDIIAKVPKLTASQVTAEFDWHARRLRMVDAAIQQANWATNVEIDDTVMEDYAFVEIGKKGK